MSKIRRLAMFFVSTAALIISAISDVLLQITDNIMFGMLIAEKMCVRCTKISDKITSEIPVCEQCAMEMENENCDCESEIQHPKSPMNTDHMHAYR